MAQFTGDRQVTVFAPHDHEHSEFYEQTGSQELVVRPDCRLGVRPGGGSRVFGWSGLANRGRRLAGDESQEEVDCVYATGPG